MTRSLPAPAFELEDAFQALPALPGFFPVALPQAGLDEAFDVEHAERDRADDVFGITGVVAVVGQGDGFDEFVPASPRRLKTGKRRSAILPG